MIRENHGLVVNMALRVLPIIYDLTNTGWNFSNRRKIMYILEHKEWEKRYLPINIKGLTILDVGAGEGETAKFFLDHGAKEVICIESDPKAFTKLLMNFINNPHRRFGGLMKRFDLEDLKLPYDFMKVDIEGYEEILLDAEIDKPCVIEVHGLQLVERFEKRGFKIVKALDDIGSIAYAYKNC